MCNSISNSIILLFHAHTQSDTFLLHRECWAVLFSDSDSSKVITSIDLIHYRQPAEVQMFTSMSLVQGRRSVFRSWGLQQKRGISEKGMCLF